MMCFVIQAVFVISGDKMFARKAPIGTSAYSYSDLYNSYRWILHCGPYVNEWLNFLNRRVLFRLPEFSGPATTVPAAVAVNAAANEDRAMMAALIRVHNTTNDRQPREVQEEPANDEDLAVVTQASEPVSTVLDVDVASILLEGQSPTFCRIHSVYSYIYRPSRFVTSCNHHVRSGDRRWTRSGAWAWARAGTRTCSDW